VLRPRPRRKSTTHLREGRRGGKERDFLYGPQRVADILSRLSDDGPRGDRAWLPADFLTEKDVLVMQPTSFGGTWSHGAMEEVVRLYLTPDDGSASTAEETTSTQSGRSDWLDRMNIVWPTQDFMSRASAANSAHKKIGTVSEEGDTNPAFVFLSSKSFNTIDLDCLSRMAVYEPHGLSQAWNRMPHIKSYARIVGNGNDSRIRKLAWFMLTSACLSQGAQGKPVKKRNFDDDAMSYSNFELGVLFCSRVQGRTGDRVYVAEAGGAPRTDDLSRGHEPESPTEDRFRNIELPVPYSLVPPAYCRSDEVQFHVTPYFHEISQGSLCGQFLLTPLGQKMSEGIVQKQNTSE